MSKAATVLCAGIAVQDLVMRVADFPTPGAKVRADDFVVVGGGCAANAAVAIARLDGRARFAGPLGGPEGHDPVSDRILADLAREGVDTSGVVRVPAASASVSIVLLDATGEKMIATRRGAGLETATPADPATLVATLDAVLADNRFPEFVLPICAAARERGIPVVLDADKATRTDDPLFAISSHVVFSSEALRQTTGLDDLAAGLASMRDRAPGFLAVTDGPNAMLWLDGRDLRRLPAFAVDAIDTLGAGDVFHGAFALALAEARDPVEAMRFASATAAIKCTRFGGIGGTPRRAEVEQFLKANC
jgi:sugar/nucleoside kinase (ribokinase family)